jgi:hypothetical protein
MVCLCCIVLHWHTPSCTHSVLEFCGPADADSAIGKTNPCESNQSTAAPPRAVPCRAVPCRAVPCRAVRLHSAPCRAAPHRLRSTLRQRNATAPAAWRRLGSAQDVAGADHETCTLPLLHLRTAVPYSMGWFARQPDRHGLGGLGSAAAARAHPTCIRNTLEHWASCASVRACVRALVCLYSRARACARMRACACARVRVCICACVSARAHAFVCVCARECVGARRGRHRIS